MTTIASDWLALAVLLSVFAWFAKQRLIALSLPFAVALAALAVWVPTGSPRFTKPPPARYTVLGADIVVDAYIDALFKEGGKPAMLYRLPYSAKAAGELQEALDGAQNGQGVQARVNGEGGVQYDGDPPTVTAPEPKQPEAPAISIP